MKNNSKSRRLLRFFFVFCYLILTVTFYLYYFNFNQRQQIGLFFSKVSEVIDGAMGAFWASFTSNYDFQKKSENEIDALKKQILQQELKLIGYRQIEPELNLLKKEISDLQKSFDYGKKITYKFILTKVYLKDPQNLFKTIILDKGTTSGIEKDQIVIAYSEDINNYVLLGRIISVDENTSKVLTVMGNEFRVGVDVDGGNTSLLEGFSNVKLILRVRFLDRNLSNPVGKEVFTSSVGDIYPSGIPIGKVTEVENREDIFQSVLVKPYIDFFKVKYAYIIIQDKEKVEEKIVPVDNKQELTNGEKK